MKAVHVFTEPKVTGDPPVHDGRWVATYEVVDAEGRRTHQRFRVVGANRAAITAAVKAELRRLDATAPAAPTAPALTQEVEA